MSDSRRPDRRLVAALIPAVLSSVMMPLNPLRADETCASPYMKKIEAQEDYVYVWTLGVEGLGDGQDKLVTVDVNPKSPTFGKVIATLSVGGRNEAHHSDFTDDRAFLWAGGLDTSKIFIFDVRSNPAKPHLVKTIEDFSAQSGGVVGPHTLYALPGRMLVSGLSNNQDHGGRTALVEYTSEGRYLATHWMPTDADLRGAIKTGQYADGYGYDVRALPQKNVLVSSSFTGWNNYMMDFGRMLKDPEAMKHFGNTVVTWNLHTRAPQSVLDVPGAPLEIRCALQTGHDYCFTTTALTSKIWWIHQNDQEQWKAEPVADIGRPEDVPLPVDISISRDDRLLWVNTFSDGKTRAFDISHPEKPVQIYEKQIGAQVNMVASSFDGKRLYYTSSLLANWDKKGADNAQFLKLYRWDGKALAEAFAIDFNKEKLGRPHQMRFGAQSLYKNLAEGSKPSWAKVP